MLLKSLLVNCVICITVASPVAITQDEYPLNSDAGPYEAQITDVDSPRAMASRNQTEIRNASQKQLRQARAGADRGLAIASEWEAVRQTIPDVGPAISPDPDAAALNRFIGFIEGRLNVNVPPIWESSVLSARSSGRRDNIWFPQPDTMEEFVEQDARQVYREGDQWIVAYDGEEISIPHRAVQGRVNAVSIRTTGNIIYVAVYGRSPTFVSLVAYDRDQSEILWQSRLWAAGGHGITFRGRQWHHVDIVYCMDRNEIIVFGLSSLLVYIEAFDAETGSPRLRFGTVYLLNM